MKVITTTPRNDAEWEQLVRGILKVHMTMADLTYADLTERLRVMRRPDVEPNVRNRINNGRFSAIFLLQCLRAMDVTELTLPTDPPDQAKSSRATRNRRAPRLGAAHRLDRPNPARCLPQGMLPRRALMAASAAISR